MRRNPASPFQDKQGRNQSCGNNAQLLPPLLLVIRFDQETVDTPKCRAGHAVKHRSYDYRLQPLHPKSRQHSLYDQCQQSPDGN